MGFEELCPGVLKNMVGKPNVSGFCQVVKIHLTIRTSILTFSRCKKTAAGVGQPSTNHYLGGTEEGEGGV
jgi:hypothetical protein